MLAIGPICDYYSPTDKALSRISLATWSPRKLSSRSFNFSSLLCTSSFSAWSCLFSLYGLRDSFGVFGWFFAQDVSSEASSFGFFHVLMHRNIAKSIVGKVVLSFDCLQGSVIYLPSWCLCHCLPPCFSKLLHSRVWTPSFLAVWRPTGFSDSTATALACLPPVYSGDRCDKIYRSMNLPSTEYRIGGH